MNDYYSPFQDDLINLFTYTVMRLTPNALSAGASSWSYLRKGSTTSNASGSLLASSTSVLDRYYSSRDTSPVGVRSYQVVRPLQHDKWSKGKDVFLVTDIWGTEVGSLSPSSPTIWLKQTEERMYLCAFQHRSLTIILFIPVTSVHNGEQGLSVVKQQILENVSRYNKWKHTILFLLKYKLVLVKCGLFFWSILTS